VSELVIVASDLYLARSSRERTGALELPGLAGLARFGAQHELAEGWRAWLARYCGRADLAGCAPAVIASAAVSEGAAAPSYLWLATPVHLTASLHSVHLGQAGILHLEGAARATLCNGFNESFAELGYQLLPTRSGDFIASGPQLPGRIETIEPARRLGSSIEDALPAGAGSAALRRLGAEIELWLHGHPMNIAREREQRAAISTLWLWGGGAFASVRAANDAASLQAPPELFGDDSYVEGLARLCATTCETVPATLATVLARAALRKVVILEVFHLHDGRGAAGQALERLDRDWLGMALQALTERRIARLTLIANDRRVTMTARSRFKLWRRWRDPLAALQ
jgi:hypothetical protein